MTVQHWRRVGVALLLSVVLLVTGCQPKAPSQFSQAQQESTQKGVTAVAKDATQGSEFNKFFPAASAGYSRTFSQEKKGFASAKLNKGGKNVAMLSINDTTGIAGAAQKYTKSTEKIGGYPMVTLGNQTTSVLVGKYQVKVQSRDPSFTPADREAWLQKFNLKGLEKLS
ncbi:hypothetical protein ACKFKF_00590 [Phormidesmis sp. 146-12]